MSSYVLGTQLTRFSYPEAEFNLRFNLNYQVL